MQTDAAQFTEQDYQSRRRELEDEIAEIRDAYDAAALELRLGGGDAKEANRLRSEMTSLILELNELDAAWRAAQERAAIDATEQDGRRRREACITAEAHIAKAVQLVRQIERTAIALGDLAEAFRHEYKAIRPTVARLCADRDRQLLDTTELLFGSEWEALLEAVRVRWDDVPMRDLKLPEHAEQRAPRTRATIRRVLGEPLTQENDS